MPNTPARRPWLLLLAAVATITLLVASAHAIAWYGHPCAEVLVDPDAVVSGIGSPSWAGNRLGLRFPDRIVAVDGAPIVASPGHYAGDAFDDAVEGAFDEKRESIDATVETANGTRDVVLPVRRLGAVEWWLDGGVLFLVAGLYVLAGITALLASPRGKLARAFALAALAAAAFIGTLFDAQTTRALVPLWYLAFAVAPGAFVTLALRLPDDAPVLRRAPWLPSVLVLAGVVAGATMTIDHLAGGRATPLQTICSLSLGASQLFFVVTFLVRFALSKGERRVVMRALLAAIAPPHALLALGIFLAHVGSRGSAASFFVSLPVLSLMPLFAVIAFLRHDLWGSRALVSRIATLAITASFACVVAIGIAAAFAAWVGIPFGFAVIAATAGGVFSAAAVALAVRLADRGFFPAHAEYKPTVDELSEHLTSITDPNEVARSVERTVKRWLACERVECIPRDPDDTPVAPVLATESEQLTLPINFRTETIGVLHVGKKKGGALFTSDDLDLLRTIVNQAALALAHARSYRELEERRRQQAEAWRGERLALVETVAAEIAHEIRYPINYFRSLFQRGARDGGDVHLDSEDVDIGQEEVDRLERLVAGLRRVAHHRLERRVVRVAELAARAEVLLRDALGSRALETDLDDGAALRGDFDQTTQVIVNLLSNAIDAAGPTGKVGLAWRPTREGGAHLVVWDTGPGFDVDAAHLFAPWFTTKPRGTGLGLAIAQRVVRAHGWSIDARREGGCTQFVVSVPSTDIVGDEDEVTTSASGPEPLHH